MSLSVIPDAIDQEQLKKRLIALGTLRAADQKTLAGLLVFAVGVVLFWVFVYEQGTTHAVKNSEKRGKKLEFLIDLNTAPSSELLMLPGIGATLADRIIERREQAEPFQLPSDLNKIKGIGVKKLEAMMPFVVVTKTVEKSDTLESDRHF